MPVKDGLQERMHSAMDWGRGLLIRCGYRRAVVQHMAGVEAEDDEREQPNRRTQFVRGLSAQHPAVLGAAALLLLPALLGLQAVFTSGLWSGGSQDRLLRETHDDFIHISWLVGRLKRLPQEKPVVCLLGGSSAREAIVDGSSLAARVADAGGQIVSAFDMGSSNQTLAATLAVVDNLPQARGVAVIGVNIGRFSCTLADNVNQMQGCELLLDSRALRRFLSRYDSGWKQYIGIVPGIATYLASYVRERASELRSFRVSSVSYELHRWSADTMRTDSQKRRMVRRWTQLRGAGFRRNFALNLSLLEEAIAAARQKGYEVLLLDLPRNDEIIGGSLSWATTKYQDACRRLASESGVRYVDLNQRVTLANSDFWDLFHLVGGARVRWESALADELAAMLTSAASSTSAREDR